MGFRPGNARKGFRHVKYSILWGVVSGSSFELLSMAALDRLAEVLLRISGFLMVDNGQNVNAGWMC